ncbi:MAG: hypothetical protein RIT42_1152, partial [Bacteroidota bacterium]
PYPDFVEHEAGTHPVHRIIDDSHGMVHPHVTQPPEFNYL